VCVSEQRTILPSVSPPERVEGAIEREREVRLRVEVVLPVALGTPGLGEAEVQRHAVAGGDPVRNPVEHAAAARVLVEPQREEVVQVTAGCETVNACATVTSPASGLRVPVSSAAACFRRRRNRG
jgi:hypothetical protein